MVDLNYEIGTAFARSRNYIVAENYLLKSIEDNNPRAMNDLGVVYEKQGEYEEAYKYYLSASELGHNTSFYNIGLFYLNGTVVKKDVNKAIECFEKSAKLGYSKGYEELAQMYEYGIGVKPNLPKAINYLKKGVKLEQKSTLTICDCSRFLAYHYNQAIGVKCNFKKAVKLWEFGAKKKDLNSIFNLAICYMYGEGVKKDLSKALETLVNLAVKNNYKEAIKTIADIYEEGEFCPIDLKESGRWLMKAAGRGEIRSLLKIADICLSKRHKQYGFEKKYARYAIYDFLKDINNKEEEYSQEYQQYLSLKEKYPNDLDWDLLETLPEDFAHDENESNIDYEMDEEDNPKLIN